MNCIVNISPFFNIQPELTVTCLGAALRLALPMVVGKKITGYFELIKPLIDFKFESIQSRGNNVFELATREEIDKLGSTTRYSSATAEYTEDINLDEVINKSIKLFLISDLFSRCSCYINNMIFSPIF